MSLVGKRVGFIGGGAMAEALAGGLLGGDIAAADILVADVDSARRTHLAETLGVRTTERNDAVVAESDVVVIAVKPQVVAEALGGLDRGGSMTRPLWISIAAGVPLSRLEIPNTRAIKLEECSVRSVAAIRKATVIPVCFPHRGFIGIKSLIPHHASTAG